MRLQMRQNYFFVISVDLFEIVDFQASDSIKERLCRSMLVVRLGPRAGGHALSKLPRL